MCTIFFALNSHPEYPFIIAANRDEFYARRSASAHWWDDAPNILGGRDLEAGGSWMAMTQEGRFAALTNYRAPHEMNPEKASRGMLVADFLRTDIASRTYVESLYSRAEHYNAFNLLVYDQYDLRWYNPKDGATVRIRRGIYGLSNAFLNTPWYKVAHGKQAFQTILRQDKLQPHHFWNFLSNATTAPHDALPDTGVGLQREKMLSALFIQSPEYGTRMQTVILKDKYGKTQFAERTFDPQKGTFSTLSFDF